MNKRNLVICDLDGTLIDYRLRAYLSFARAVEHKTPTFIAFAEFVKLRIEGKSNYEIFLENTTLQIEAAVFGSRVIDTIETKELLIEDRLFDDTLSWMNEVNKIADLVICTARRNQANLDWQLGQLGFDSGAPFSLLFATETKSRVLDLFIRKNNYCSSHIFMVGDSYSDMTAGKEIDASLYFVERGLHGASQVRNDFQCNISKALPALDFSL